MFLNSVNFPQAHNKWNPSIFDQDYTVVALMVYVYFDIYQFPPVGLLYLNRKGTEEYLWYLEIPVTNGVSTRVLDNGVFPKCHIQ